MAEQEIDDYISTANDVAIDLTKGTEYRRLVTEEIDHYSHIETTGDFFEAGVHAHKAWTYNHEFIYKNIFKTTLWDEVADLANRAENPRILSLGCGYGGIELQVARRLRSPYELIAVDLNPSIFRGALRRAESEGLNVKFKCVDLNFVDIRPASFDVIYAYASLHHVLNLEHLFTAIHRGLRDGGKLVIIEVIGKTQVLYWEENVEFAAEVVRKMPYRYKPRRKRFWKNWSRWFDPYTILPRYVEPAIQVGMEGIRQEEIEPLILRWFDPLKVFKYNAFMRMICTNPYLGNRIDPDREADRNYLDELMKLDYEQVQSGKLRPTEMFSVYNKR